MPELPEVQTIVNTLRPRVVGRMVARVRLERDDIVTPTGTDLAGLLTGRRIRQIVRRAKRIVFTLDNAAQFYIHLGMSGRLETNRPDDPVKVHTHLVLELAAAKANRMDRSGGELQLRFTDPRRFGGIWWIASSAACDDRLGPEPLEIRPRQLAQRLGRTRRAVKNALLDQSLLAGLGNIYVDESLFAAGIHPLTPANMLTAEQVQRLNRAIKATLRRALRHRGSTLRDYRDSHGNPGQFQKLHRVYARADKPCPVCRASIQRIVLGGRSTHFCPACQAR